MDTLKNKRFAQFNYTCRYTSIPYYYDKLADKEIFGIGKPMLKTTAWVAHKVQQEDTLDSLALKYYNNPTLWWLIAYFNDILDPFKPLLDSFEIIKIPSSSSIKFGDFR